jgi:hypothetical protein
MQRVVVTRWFTVVGGGRVASRPWDLARRCVACACRRSWARESVVELLTFVQRLWKVVRRLVSTQPQTSSDGLAQAPRAWA